MSGGFGLPILNLQGGLATIGEKFEKGYDQAQAPEILAALLRGQGGGQAPAPLAALAGQPVGAQSAPTDGLAALGAQAKSPLPTFARAQGSAPSANIRGLINDVATRNDVDPAYLGRLVQIESGGNPGAYNKGSGASGLGQFIPSTARAYGLADPFDPAKNLQATAELTLDNKDTLRQRLGRDPTPGELYLGHQQGAAGAAKLLANPDVPAERLVGRKAVVANGGTPGMTAREFAQKWTSRFDGQRSAVASAEPDAANMPAPGATPAGFVIPGTAAGLPGNGAVARSIDPDLLARALNNSVTAPFATAAIGAQFKSGDDYSVQAVGDSLYRVNKRTGAIEQVPGVSKPQTTVVSPGGTLVDQVTGRPLYSVPEKPTTIAAGSTVYDPATNKPLFTAPEKESKPSFVQMNGRMLLTDPDTGGVRDVTPKDLPQGYRPATPQERQAYGAKEDAPLIIGPDGRPQTIGGQTINVNGGEKAQDSKIGGAYGDVFNEMQSGGRNAIGQLNTYRLMEKLIENPNFYSGTQSGPLLAARRAAAALGIKDADAAAPNELFAKLATQSVLDKLGGSLGAGVSNSDVLTMQNTVANATNTPEGNRQILQFSKALAQRQIEVAKLARQYAATHNNRLDPGFDDELAAYAEKNPLTVAPTAIQAQQAAPTVQPPAQAAPSSPTVLAPPQVGVVMKGYRFKGGDPGSPTSWERAQ